MDRVIWLEMGGGSPSRSNNVYDFSWWLNTGICSSVGSSRSRASYWFDLLVKTWWWVLAIFFFVFLPIFSLCFLRFVLACQNWKLSWYFVDVSSLNLIFYCYLFILNSFFYWYFFRSSLSIWFHLIFISSLVLIFFIAICLFLYFS